MTKPTITVWTSPALGGKTRRCVELCVQEPQSVCWVLPSELQAMVARAMLQAEGVPAHTAERTVKSLHSFALQLVRSRREQFQTVSAPLRRWMIGRVLQQVAHTHPLLQGLERREGVLTLLVGWVREMARENITPELLDEMAAHTRDREKAAALARILRLYRHALVAEGLHEEDDVYRIAAQAVPQALQSAVIPRRILLDGFSRFTYTELQLIEALVMSGKDVTITLCWDERRQVLFESTRATLSQLAQRFNLLQKKLTPQQEEQAASYVNHIASHLFEPQPTPMQPLDASATPSVEIWEAPHILAEAEMVARELVRLHRHGMAWGEMAVFCRHIDSVLPVIEGVLQQFSVPYQHFQIRLLSDHPLVRALMGWLELPFRDYLRDDVLQWLKSGYVPIETLEADRVRAQAVRRGIRSGAQNWLRLAEELQSQGFPAGQYLRELIESTQRVRSASSPQVWLEAFYKGLNQVHAQLPDDSTQHVLQQVIDVATQVVGLMSLDEGGSPVEWTQAVMQACGITPLQSKLQMLNAVWLLEATQSRPLRPRVAFVMGVQEGRFPRRVTEDALLRDDEREWLNAQANRLLVLSGETLAMERFSFYQVATCAAQRVVFTYSRMEGEHDVQPSFYLRTLRELFSTEQIVQRSQRLSDVSAPLSHTVDERDVERTLVDSLFDFNPHTRRVMDDSERQQTAHRLKRWLDEKPEQCLLWWRWRFLPEFPRLHNPTVLRVGERAYSASELEDLQQCPFRYFLRWQLRLREEREHYAAKQGRWLHAVLHRRHRAPEQSLQHIVQDVTEQDPIDRPMGERQLMLQQLEDMATSVTRREEQMYSAFGLRTMWIEQAFGPAMDEEGGEAERQRPLRIQLPNGSKLLLCGRVDRLDVCPQTGDAVLIDYKRDVPQDWWGRIQSSNDLQTVLYVAAMRQVWKMPCAAVALDSALGGKRYRVLFTDVGDRGLLQRLNRLPQEDAGVVRVANAQVWQTIERKTASRVQELLERLSRGDVSPTPGDHCKLCEYGGICRVTRTAGQLVHDGEPYPEPL